MSIWIRINGYPATEIAPHSPVTWETAADGGSFKASWSFALTTRSQHQALRVDSLVEILCGPLPIWTGTLAYPDRTSQEYTAYGMAAQAKKYLALDGTGATTRDVGVAITQAIARGWRVSNPTNVSGVAAGTATGNPITLAQLLDERATELGMRWGVDGAGIVYMRADPTGPTWLAAPGAAAFGTANEDTAKRLAGRFLNSATSLYDTAYAGAGIPEEATDVLLDRDAMTMAQAQAALAGMLTLSKAQTAWTNGATLTRDQITTMGGSSAFLPSVRGGQLMRSFGLSYATNALALDTVIGLARQTQGESSIYVEPVNLAASSTPFAA